MNPVASPARGVCPQGALAALGWAAAAAAYLWLRAATTLAASNGSFLMRALLAAECAVAARLVVMAAWLVPRRERLEPPARLLAANSYEFHVHVLVPCYNETVELVAQTLLAARAARLPAGCTRQLWLCDDGGDAAKRALIERWRAEGGCCDVHYVTGRPKVAGSGNGKAQNLNYALLTAIYPQWPSAPIPANDVLCVVDADMILAPEFFEATLPYLYGPRDAVVQAPQHFHNYHAAADALDHASALKNHHCRHGLVHGLGGASINGTGFVARMAAVAEAGWWETASVCEDQRLAMALERLGYKGHLLLDGPLQVGEAPQTVRDAYRQRARFIAGYMGNVFGPRGALWDARLKPAIRLLGNGVHQDLFCALYMPILWAAPVAALLAGAEPFAWHPSLPALWLLHYAASQLVLLARVTRTAEPYLKSPPRCWLANLQATHLYAHTALGVAAQLVGSELKGVPLDFVVTPKSNAAAAALAPASTPAAAANVELFDSRSDAAGCAAPAPAAVGGGGEGRHLTGSSLCSSVDAVVELALPPGKHSAGDFDGEFDGEFDIAAPPLARSASKADAAAMPAGAMPAVVTYRRPGEVPPPPRAVACDGPFPWREAGVPAAVLALSLTAAAAGTARLLLLPLLMRAPADAAAAPLRAEVVAACALWALHNAAPPALMVLRWATGEGSRALHAACWAVPRAVAGVLAVAAALIVLRAV